MLRFLLIPLATLFLFTNGLIASAIGTQWYVLESGAVTTTPELLALFPKKFAPEDITAFNSAAKQTQIADKTYTVDDNYTQKVQGYRIQFLTARDAQRAEQISFTGVIEVVDGNLVGTYQYTSSYQKAMMLLLRSPLPAIELKHSTSLNLSLGSMTSLKGMSHPSPLFSIS